MPLVETFLSDEDETFAQSFLANGYVIFDVADRQALDEMRHRVVEIVCRHLDCPIPNDDGEFLETMHNRLPTEQLNALRLSVYREMNKEPWLRPTYFRLARQSVETLVGNELAMQNRVCLSIQMPNDTSSLLDIHADVFSGETPFQIVEWLPLVDVFATKSMFILPRQRSLDVVKDLSRYSDLGMAGLYEELKDELVWLDIPYGKVLLFSPNCLHGNTVNGENETRWSFNCRFAPLLGPYFSEEKALGSFYLPITTKPATRIGLEYSHPVGFSE
jgi:sporadic carbohydrate cluster 2OG-Fe(II) oxygenase